MLLVLITIQQFAQHSVARISQDYPSRKRVPTMSSYLTQRSTVTLLLLLLASPSPAVTVFPSNTEPRAYDHKGLPSVASSPEDLFRQSCPEEFSIHKTPKSCSPQPPRRSQKAVSIPHPTVSCEARSMPEPNTNISFSVPKKYGFPS